MSLAELLPLSPFVVLGAVLGLDVVAFPQVMLSRPIVAATLAGALAGAPPEERGRLTSFRLLRLKETSAVGAAWKAAQKAGLGLPVDFAAMAEVLDELKA